MTEGKAEGVPFFFTGRCLVGGGGAVAHDPAPLSAPSQGSQSESRGLRSVGVQGPTPECTEGTPNRDQEVAAQRPHNPP